ncbi:junction-mediating and -regulatory protein-like [Benincasa hispida]|uniref:junction-mediating and -regulatory protein-like n=1 Tax=Benincasa hispida TaxID=102211 RepID=UPI001901668A|nr:junction-mediating and -regulatory protein-like [Benincasa hispida]
MIEKSINQNDYQWQSNLELSLRLPSPPPLESPPPPPPYPPPLESPPPPSPLEYPLLSTTTSLSPRKTPNESEEIPTQHNNETSNHQQQPMEIVEPQPRPRRRRTRADMTRIEPPYPWSTDRRAVIHELKYLQSNNIVTIKGEVKCKKCEQKYEMEYDLMNKFNEIARFIEYEKDSMHDRAPKCWTKPILPNCNLCNKERCVEPVISEEDYTKINWLFLLLGKFLGCLKLKQLKYFCAQTNIHRTGAKNRLLYLIYLTLCYQLQPSNELFTIS